MSNSWLLARRASVSAISLALGAAVSSAIAADETTAETTLGEVIVTAERVESNVQRTAISIEVMDSDAIKESGLNNITQLSTLSPSVSVTGFGGGTVITVRGISSRDTTEIGDPAVVVSYDGFYQDRSYALGLAQYDLERIEILRGPQGTLYGRNATGGAINVYTTRPGKQAGGYVQLEAGNYGTLNAEGGINMPINDTMAVRASFGTAYHAPYHNDPGSPNNYQGLYGGMDDANSRSGRLQFAFDPNENFSARFTLQHTVQTALGNSPLVFPYAVDANGWPVHDVAPAVPSDVSDYRKYWFTRLNLNDNMFRYDMSYRAPFATITYLGGYDQLSWNSIVSGPNYLAAPYSATNPNPVYRVQAYNQTEKPKTINQELRFASPNADSRLQWQAGVYFFRNHNDLDSYNFAPNGTPPAGSLTSTPVAHFIYDVTIKSLAEMAHLSYRVTDRLKLSGGFRHNKDEKTRQGYIGAFETLPPTQTLIVSPGTNVDKDTYSLGVDFQITPDNLLYAKYGTGYKSGGFTDLGEYGPESIKTAEIGSKNRFLDNRLEANFAVYDSDYTGQQVSQIVQDQGGGTGAQRIVNAGKTRYRGVEADLTWVTQSNRVQLNVAWLDAEFKDFALSAQTQRWTGSAWSNQFAGTAATGFSSPYFGPHAVVYALPNPAQTNVQLAGNRPIQAPEWTLGVTLEHIWKLGGGDFTGRINTKYQTEQFYTFFNRPDDRQKPYALTNLQFTYKGEGSSWRYQAYVNNVTDEVVYSNAAPNDRNNNYAYTFLPPRTYGLRVNYTW